MLDDHRDPVSKAGHPVENAKEEANKGLSRWDRRTMRLSRLFASHDRQAAGIARIASVLLRGFWRALGRLYGIAGVARQCCVRGRAKRKGMLDMGHGVGRLILETPKVSAA
jgi:hypothetical protein